MAWGRSHALRGALILAGVLIILQYMYGFRVAETFDTFVNITAPSQWPKRTHARPQIMNQLSIIGNNGNATIDSSIVHNNNTKNIISYNINNLSVDNKISVTNNSLVSPVIGLLSGDTRSLINHSTYLMMTENNLQNSDNTVDLKSKYNNSTIMKALLPLCSFVPPGLVGSVTVDKSIPDMNVLLKQFNPLLSPGGLYSPSHCKARDRVAIIIPYRDRAENLAVLLNNLHPFLMKQQIQYVIYVVEQTQGTIFNRAALMNVGFVEALRDRQWDCLIFHDVDLLPLDDRNLYSCPDQPRHMSVAVDVFKYKLPYTELFGGVSAMTVQQFKAVNGFSNLFWGWGGEDDDMSNRIKHYGFHIARYPFNIARYTMLGHVKQKANPKRYDTLYQGKKRYGTDGLNSLHYTRRDFERRSLYTWLLVELTPPAVS